ncbi:hypothetical protein BDE02_08G040600 [Populus trichocarpa]|nr:hypothetical protein BDE02_08G040600 [Populus trichocarpa]
MLFQWLDCQRREMEMVAVSHFIYKHAFIKFDFLILCQVLQGVYVFGARLYASLFRFWDKTSLISEFANITKSFCFLSSSFSALMSMLLAEGKGIAELFSVN